MSSPVSCQGNIAFFYRGSHKHIQYVQAHSCTHTHRWTGTDTHTYGWTDTHTDLHDALSNIKFALSKEMLTDDSVEVFSLLL